MKVDIYNADCLEQLEKIEENSIDSIVTDPPYELNFMGKGWDNAGISFNKNTWEKCLKVLKPGGYLLAFGGSRTYHRIACAIEDAGFEIRDTIMWLYGSGFPKSMALDKSLEAKLTTGSGNKKDFYKCNGTLEESKGKDYTSMKQTNVEQEFRDTNYQSKGQLKLEATTNLAKKYKGYGTALKPSFEPIIVARKPFKGSLVDNVIEYGVGGINIDECRVGNEPIKSTGDKKSMQKWKEQDGRKIKDKNKIINTPHWNNGRFPANTILTYDEKDFDEVCGGFPNTKSNGGKQTTRNFTDYNGGSCNSYMNISNRKIDTGRIDTGYIAPCDSGSASRYFYCAKASRKDRDEGLEDFEESKVNDGRKKDIDNAFQRGVTLRHNIHPTVKPTTLMQYLVRLVTPKGGIILDPFMGSGSTGKAVIFENKERQANYSFIGIEKEKEYCDIARARIEWAKNYKEEKEEDNQIHIDELGGLI